MIVRSAHQSDWEQWLPLWEGYNTFYERVIPIEVTRMTWGRFFDAYEPMHALVAEEDNRLLGFVHYLFHRTTATIEPVCYLQDLFTKADDRARGAGRAMIEAVYAAADKAGATRVYWNTQETNTRARILYDKVAERSGFIQYHKRWTRL